MIRKCISVLVVLTLFLTAGVSVSATEETVSEHIRNGDFEVIGDNGIPAAWGVTGGKLGEGLAIEEKDLPKDGGGHAVAIKPQGKAVYVSQLVKTLIPGEEYTFSAMLKIVENEDQRTALKLEFAGASGESIWMKYSKNDAKDWTKISFTFTYPEAATKVSVLLRNTSTGGEILWDNVSIMGKGEGQKLEVSTTTKTETAAKEEVKLLSLIDGVEHITNGGFEELQDSGMPTRWNASGGSLGEGILLDETDKPADGGTRSAVIKPQGEAVYLSQTVKTLIPGEEYTFSAMLKIVENEDQRSSVKLDFAGASSESVWNKYSKSDAKDWTNITFTFTYPEAATAMYVMLRNTTTSGEIKWDNISVVGKGEDKTADTEEPKEDLYVEMPEFATETAKNGNFETVLEDGTCQDWTASEEYTTNISVSTEEARSGNHSIKIKWMTGNPFIKQDIYNPVEGATYQASFWYKIASSGEPRPGFKIEWYQSTEDGGKAYINGVWVNTPPVGVKSDEWTRYTYHFTIPEGCDFFQYYIRVYREGEVYFDDASCYMIEQPEVQAVTLSTDEVFYYSDMETGIATAVANRTVFSNISQVSFALQDGDTVLTGETVTPDAEGLANYRFDLSYLKEETKQYKIVATAKDAEGNLLGTSETVILKYPRPTMLRPDGSIVLKNGEPFHPIFAYHVVKEDIKRVAEMGVNTVQGYGLDVGPIREYLDEAEKYNVKVLVRLYPNMKPAGHPDNVEYTTRVITALKDHPAVLAWMVMDEVFSYFPEAWDLLYDSYTLIRSLDMDHPVYILQNTATQFDAVAKYTDILAYDPYPSLNVNLTRHVANHTQQAVAATNSNKPVWCLNKAYAPSLEPEKERKLPTITEERNLWYQGLFEGAFAIGFYSFSDCIGTPDMAIYETDLWDGLVEFSKAEMAESYNYFLKGEYPVFADGRGEDAWYSAYVKDGKLRLIVLNRHESETAVTIPLKNDSGSITVGDFTAEAVYGGSGTVTGNGSLTVTLPQSAVIVYEITTSEAMDFSGQSATKFRDLEYHTWAADSIRELGNKGIVTGVTPISYEPGTKITRGDFAMFLINTLGLTAETTENFVDVKPEYRFAEAIAIGKALGILKGVGDNRFNPYTEISRQDMMVICARGMRLARELDTDGNTDILGSFSDTALIADYAVLDVAAMIRASIIKGNADGTINPTGNATRAETAVIMQRIQTWKDAL